MKCTYDLHIHTCLSPCGDDDMTPNNIANMAALSGLDVIAVTDHNTAGNARAVVEAGEKAGVCVVPGIELETSEEVHVLLLFGDVAAAEKLLPQTESVIDSAVSKGIIHKNNAANKKSALAKNLNALRAAKA